MLVELAIRDVVLIERLELTLGAGLTGLTGETGAGKSILLDALGLALGARGDAGLVRVGAAQASVAATFEVPNRHSAHAIVEAAGISRAAGDPLVLRRILTADGRSRAYIDDQPVSVGLLRQVGDALVEVQGQFEQRGLLDAATHRSILDAFGKAQDRVAETAVAYRAWREAETGFRQAEADAGRAKADESYLADAIAELDRLGPKPGEDAALASDRRLLMNAGKLQAAIEAAIADVGGERGAERLIGQALRGLDRIRDAAEGRLDPAVGGLERALAELTEALRCLAAEGRALGENPRRLNDVEERLFALREIARKHNVPVDALAELRQRLGQRLAEAATAEDRLARLREAAAAARGRYAEAAATLSEVRRTTAKRLDKRVAAELPPLKLEKAKFRTAISRSDETDWSAHGTDRIAFEAATNPGSEAGPLAKIASGGELARFMLALKVVLAEAAPADTLVFDEVDAGVGGAVADAVGERLARLARQLQVLVVTHSPQVAARVDEHWRVTKELSGRGSVTRLLPLDADARREEIARMLSGAEVTDAARAAADSLIAGGRR